MICVLQVGLISLISFFSFRFHFFNFHFAFCSFTFLALLSFVGFTIFIVGWLGL